jgi:hexosaminidase
MKLKLPKSRLASELVRLLPATFSLTAGIPCRFETNREKGFRITPRGKDILIESAGADDQVLALGELLAMGEPAAMEKIPALSFRGIMLDASRNAVVNVDFIKERIGRLALLGLNRFCLYTEDTYPVPGEPLFGYARGGYTQPS